MSEIQKNHVQRTFSVSQNEQTFVFAFHFCREKLEDGVIDVVHCGTDEMAADIMTKPLAKPLFEKMRSKLGVVSANDSVGRENIR